MALFEIARDLQADADLLRRRFHGIIETRDGQLSVIYLRPWPATVSIFRLWRDMWGRTVTPKEDVCRLYFDQLRSQPNYMALKYVVSHSGTSFATARAAARVLDEIARIKRTDAIVCEARNARISDRLLARWGWQRHVLTSKRRHFIKRFYGYYPVRGGLSLLDSKVNQGTQTHQNHTVGGVAPRLLAPPCDLLRRKS